MFQLFINNRQSKPAQQASSWQEKLSCSGWIMQIGEITPLPHFMRRQIMSYPSANALGKEEHFGETAISQNRTLCSCSRGMNFPSKLQYYQLLVLRFWCAAALGALPLQSWLELPQQEMLQMNGPPYCQQKKSPVGRRMWWCLILVKQWKKSAGKCSKSCKYVISTGAWFTYW